ncbi:MAG: nucleotidyltransferase domain-containing protein [Elusimicrobia bacterium]|nr:nucleotidyltransferase domain-containing protein [Elusimicrobiota bacterium]
MINAPKQYLLTIKRILQKHLSDAQIRAFGSRVVGKSKIYSDLDLVIVAKTKVNSKVLMKLKEEFEESDVPFRVDIIDWHRISEEFKRIINRQYEVL